MTAHTLNDMIAKHGELKAYIEEEDAAYEARMKPYKQGLEALKTACGVQLLAQNPGRKVGETCNFSCDDGTAYIQDGLSVKVDNRQEFLNFVAADHLDFLDVGVLKDPVRAYIAENETAPPGIVATPFVKCLIRR